MPTYEERYRAATAYTRHALSAVEAQALRFAWFPALAGAEWYAGRTKTEVARAELSRVEAAWLRATSDADRGRIARDAERLADRVQENVAGAPQDRARTNLTPGEVPASTAATSYLGTLSDDAEDSFAWLDHKADGALESARGLSGWLVAAGVVALGWRFVREREQRALLDNLGREIRRVDEREQERSP